MGTLFFEDLPVGFRRESEKFQVTGDEIVAYARRFDPQPFHTDPDAARNTLFKGLAASGWHTASLTMRMIVDALDIAGGVIGAGVDELRWPRPTRPDDTLHAELEVIEARVSNTRPHQGWIKMRITTVNQDGQTAQSMIANIVVPRRTDALPEAKS